MPTEIERLEDQLKRALEGEAWHGPSVAEVLADVTPEVAYAHPVPGAHSIWELVLHLIGTYRLVLRRLKGEIAPLTPSEDWPSVPEPIRSNWEETVRSLRQVNEQLRHGIHDLHPARLDQPLVAAPSYTAYTQLIGITQHDLYHAGQIVVLKKALAAMDTRSVTLSSDARTTMPELITAPHLIPVPGNKIIEEFVGRVNNRESQVSVARMRSPPGWSEPGQRPDFDEFTVVLNGALHVQHEQGVLEVGAGQAVVTRKGEWVRYSTPQGAEYVAICVPAFAPDTVHRDV